jgi:FlaA1/EpsC-like NDP-sugar epimerase
MNELKLACAEIVPFVGDIRDLNMLEELFSLHKPDVVLHAAAYKHVPVMEAHPCEAILNNVMAPVTWLIWRRGLAANAL